MGKRMAPFSFLIALAVNTLFSIEGSDIDQPIEVPQFVEEYFNGSFHMHQSLKGQEFHDKCTFFILQKLFQQRMESSIGMAEGSEDHLLQSQIEAIKMEGFSEDEFKRVKLQSIAQIDTFSSNMAITEIPETEAVLNASKHVIEKMQLADLSSHLTSFINDEPHTFRLSYPEPAHNEWIFDTSDEISIRFADNPLSEEPLFFINTHSSQIDAFYQLPLEEKEQKLIHELIRTIAEKNIWGLLFKKKELEKIGKKVNVVHPMRFMGYILSEPRLKKWLREIRNSSFKWDHFIEGFADRMKDENAKSNLIPYIAGMAHLLHVDQSQILGFIHAKDYEGLVKSFL